VSAHGNRSVESFSAWAAQSFSDADAAKGGDAAEAFAAKATLGDTGDRLAAVAARSGGQVSPGGQVSAGGQASPIVQTASSGGEQMQAAEPSMQTANARSTGAQGASATGAEGGRPVTPGSTGFRVEQALNAEFERGVVGRLRDNGEMRLAIEREGLGELDVRVAVRESSVHASIATQHDEARQLLASQRADLETALQRHNLRLDSFDVDVGGREGRGTARQDGDQAQHGGGAAGGATGLQDRAGGTAANDAAERLQPREWGGGLSVRV
jgi:flagellar hook-length control protein FliK